MSKSLLAALALLSAPALTAQTIGSLPDQSPYLDLNDHMRLGLVAGMLATGSDAVGVGPKSAPVIGLRYDLPIGGPIYLSAVVFGASTTRTVLDYTKSPATRDIGTQSMGLLNANLSVAMALTGARTWHHFQPLVNLGFGFVTAPGDKLDVSGYQFANAFSFSYGLGVRYATGHYSEFRFDLNQYWWELKYPPNYRSTQGGTPIRPIGALGSWTANTALTLAWSLRIFR